jgi:YVTN family beta-propeller protein
MADGGTNRSLSGLRTFGKPQDIAINPTTNLAYTADPDSNQVEVINGSTLAIVARIPVGQTPVGVAVNAATNRIYVANHLAGTVSVIDGAKGQVVATIPTSGRTQAVAVNPTTNRIYATNFDNNQVRIIDGRTNTVTGVISSGIGGEPMGVAVDPSVNRIYVANLAANTVSIIDGPSSTVAQVVPVGLHPWGVAVNPSTHLVYVTNSGFNSTAPGGNTVSVIGVVPAPSAWTLTAAGPIGKGASVRPVLKKARLIGLVVFRLPKHTLVGVVPLGRHSGSKQRIPWNLKVNGKTLKSGSYEVELRVFTAAGKPAQLPGPNAERLVIKNGRVRVIP